jgi:hypothetical protein
VADFTAEQIETIANSTLDFYHDRKKVKAQSLQNKPLLKALRAKEKPFPGGKEFISFAAKFDYNETIQGWVNDDEVGYDTLANTRRGQVPWYLIHKGFQFGMHEMAKDGINIVDTVDGKKTSEISGRDMQVLVNILEEKIDNFEEGWDRGFNLMYWRDGTQDAKLVPGIRSFILDDPTTATVVQGIDQSVYPLWRNRAEIGMTATTASDQNVLDRMGGHFRQLRRFGGNPNLMLCGSDWLEWIEKELKSKGNYTMTGWAKGIDASVADVQFKGLTFEYDPTLDDLGLDKYCFVLDTRTIMPRPVEGQADKNHNPARPENKYVFYRARTWMGGLMCNQRNANGVFSIA